MKFASLIGAAAILVAAPSFAQSDAPRTTDKPAAVASPNDVNKTTAAPVAGKNSFTEKQVMKRLKDHGYTNISGLMKDDQSVWHGKAMMAGKSVMVALDYQGNITAK
jgi:hypothetical protein